MPSEKKGWAVSILHIYAISDSELGYAKTKLKDAIKSASDDLKIQQFPQSVLNEGAFLFGMPAGFLLTIHNDIQEYFLFLFYGN